MLHVLMLVTAALGPGEGKTMALDAWHSLTILEVGGSNPGGPHYLRVAAGDLDGDGRADEVYLKLVCADGAVRQAAYSVASPRDAAKLATGKRQQKPITLVKEWGPATPQLRTMKTTYDVKKNEGARTAGGGDGWTQMQLGNTDDLCTATEAAATTIVKSKSNITNN